MGNIINDIVEDVNIRPNKTKIVFRWILIVAVTLIGLAFAFGQFKSSFFTRMDSFETNLNKQTIVIRQLQTEMTSNHSYIDTKIDKVYNDGFTAFEEYQSFNKEQLLLVLDYGQTNKDLLKRMIELNTSEKTRKVETQLEQAKTETRPEGNIIARQIKSNTKSPDFIKLTYDTEKESGDTLFHLTGATKKFINNINRKKYEVGAISESLKYPNLYNVSYRNK